MGDIIEQIITESKERLGRFRELETYYRDKVMTANNSKEKIRWIIGANLVEQQIQNLEGKTLTKEEEKERLLRELEKYQYRLDEIHKKYKNMEGEERRLFREATIAETSYLEEIIWLGVKRYIDLTQWNK
jgi:superfamily II DNA helicase RecQ